MSVVFRFKLTKARSWLKFKVGFEFGWWKLAHASWRSDSSFAGVEVPHALQLDPKNVAFTSGSAECSYAIHLAASNEFWPRHALLGVSIEGPLAKCGKSEESNLVQHSSS